MTNVSLNREEETTLSLYISGNRSHQLEDIEKMDEMLKEFRGRQILLKDPVVISLLCLYAVVLIIGTIGNSLILHFIRTGSKGQERKNHLLTNLCVSDLLVVLICSPTTMFSTASKMWLFGQFWCSLISYLQGVSVTSGTLSMTAMSLDRYLLVRHPTLFRNFNRNKMSVVYISFVWLMSLVISMPLLFARKIHYFEAREVHLEFCLEEWTSDFKRRVFSLVSFLLVYLMPCIALLTCHWSVCKSLRSGTLEENGKELIDRNEVRKKAFRIKPSFELASNVSAGPLNAPPPSFESDAHSGDGTWGRRDAPGVDPSSITRRLGSSNRTRRRLANLLMGMTLCFVGFWLPYHLASFYVDLYPSEVVISCLPYALLLGHAHSAVNPIVYWVLNKNARNKMNDRVKFRSALVKSQATQRLARNPSLGLFNSAARPGHTGLPSKSQGPRSLML